MSIQVKVFAKPDPHKQGYLLTAKFFTFDGYAINGKKAGCIQYFLKNVKHTWLINGVIKQPQPDLPQNKFFVKNCNNDVYEVNVKFIIDKIIIGKNLEYVSDHITINENVQNLIQIDSMIENNIIINGNVSCIEILKGIGSKGVLKINGCVSNKINLFGIINDGGQLINGNIQNSSCGGNIYLDQEVNIEGKINNFNKVIINNITNFSGIFINEISGTIIINNTLKIINMPQTILKNFGKMIINGKIDDDGEIDKDNNTFIVSKHEPNYLIQNHFDTCNTNDFTQTITSKPIILSNKRDDSAIKIKISKKNTCTLSLSTKFNTAVNINWYLGN